MSARRFRIAFSFAGEMREFVARVAAVLANRFNEETILYDKYHEAELARRDLGIYLPELYHKESDLVVVVVCSEYDVKQWTGLEWIAIHDLMSKRRHDEVMLCRFDRATVTGLYSTAGFIELDEKNHEQTATLILERLALNEGKPRDHYTKSEKAAEKVPPRSWWLHVPSEHPLMCLSAIAILIACWIGKSSFTVTDSSFGDPTTELDERSSSTHPDERVDTVLSHLQTKKQTKRVTINTPAGDLKIEESIDAPGRFAKIEGQCNVDS